MIVSVNMSMTADGQVRVPAEENLDRIGNRADLERMKKLRRESDAILVGAGTVIANNTALGVGEEHIRERQGLRYPLRVCLTGRQMPYFESRIFKPELGGTTFLFCGEYEFPMAERLYKDCKVICKGKGHHPKIQKVLSYLERELAVEKLLVEGGPFINGAFLRADLVDYYHVTMCPYIFGGSDSHCYTPFWGFNVENKDDRKFVITEMERSDDWVFLTYRRDR